MEFHNKRETVDLVHLSSWLETESVPEPYTPERVMEMIQSKAAQKWPALNVGLDWVKRYPGDPLFSQVDSRAGIIEIYRQLRIVERVEDIHTEIALEDIPFEILEVPRHIGHVWYQYIVFLLVPDIKT